MLDVPADAARTYDPDGRTISYLEAGQIIGRNAALLQEVGNGYGHRIAVLLENRPENLLFKLAFAKLGIS